MSEQQGQAQRWRLFFALWPGEQVRARLQALNRVVSSRVEGRSVPLENVHITLAFLGFVDAGGRACVEQAADTIVGRPFDLVFDTIGYWRRPRVLWVGASETPSTLQKLAQDLQQALLNCPVAHDERPYQAHLTLMRNVRHAPPPLVVEPIDWHVDEFVLVSSRMLPRGSEYSVLRRWPLC